MMNSNSSIRQGYSLYPNTSLPSPNRLFGFGFYPQGNKYAVGIWLSSDLNNTVVWTFNRDGPLVSSNSTIYFNGTHLLLTDTGDETLISDYNNPGLPAVYGFMLDSGNLVLCDRRSRVVWESFNSPTDTILGGQTLSNRGSLVSSKSSSDPSSGRFTLDMQTDGNLVAYPVNSAKQYDDAYWSSNSFSVSSTEDMKLHLTQQGFLILVGGGIIQKNLTSDENKPGNDTSNGNVAYRATLEVDGKLNLYRHVNSANPSTAMLWSAIKDGECKIKGFCGWNSFCNGTGECDCFPGFDFIDASNKFMGCHDRSYNQEETNCGLLGAPEERPDIIRVLNTRIGSPVYSFISSPTVQECEEYCLQDCDCEVASYFNGTCIKSKLPITYATLNRSDSSVVLLKRGTPHRIGVDNRPSSSSTTSELIVILGSSLGSVTIFCSLIALFAFLVYRHRVHAYENLSKDSNLEPMQELALQSFAYGELFDATSGFTEEIWKNPFWTIFKGTLAVGVKVVAVKRFDRGDEEGEHEVRSEMSMTGRTHHKNLVRLLGFCSDGPKKLLVYEHTTNGSLADLLFGTQTRIAWREKVRIGLEVAKGILYLHEECELQIVHCDLKPGNIIMDQSWTPKISNFGFAKVFVPNQSTRVVDVGGTSQSGYTAPELQKGLLSTKVDIYSFGVVLIEMVFETSGMDVINVSDLLVELKLLVRDGDVGMTSLERMVKVGMLCVLDDPELRPPINDVILMLEGIMDIPNHPSSSSSSDMVSFS